MSFLINFYVLYLLFLSYNLIIITKSKCMNEKLKSRKKSVNEHLKKGVLLKYSFFYVTIKYVRYSSYDSNF